MRMRSPRAAYAELKATDPQCGLGISGLYRLIAEGIIPSVRVGRKCLIDLDYLEDYLSGKVSSEAAR